jgi:hydrogenase maturation protease
VRTLVAGVGNVFLSDDGFGSEVARRLLASGGLPGEVDVVDVGIRGMHLAYQVLEGYRVLVVVDTTHGDGPPGSLYLLEHDLAAMSGDAAFDPHGMEPDAVLELIGALARGVGTHELDRVLVLGCEPAHLGEGMGLTPAVATAVDAAVDAVRRLVERLIAGRPLEPRAPEPRTKETTDEEDPRGCSAGRRRLGGEGVAPRHQAVPAPARDVAGHGR